LHRLPQACQGGFALRFVGHNLSHCPHLGFHPLAELLQGFARPGFLLVGGKLEGVIQVQFQPGEQCLGRGLAGCQQLGSLVNPLVGELQVQVQQGSRAGSQVQAGVLRPELHGVECVAGEGCLCCGGGDAGAEHQRKDQKNGEGKFQHGLGVLSCKQGGDPVDPSCMTPFRRRGYGRLHPFRFGKESRPPRLRPPGIPRGGFVQALQGCPRRGFFGMGVDFIGHRVPLSPGCAGGC